MDVGEWLRGLGLGQYEAAFRDNAIGVDVLADLTDGELEELGLPLGDRKRLLKAIAGAVGLPATAITSEPAQAAPRPAAAQSASAERRHLTVMFCDLVGSTGLAAQLDAEDWRNFVSAYFDAASEAVTQMGGRVVKTLGDGLMALFGHPIAQENDSERAVRAALAIQRALADLNRRNAGSGRPDLVARIGVESGTVVVEAAGEIFGEAPNVAARVQSLAEPGTVLVTANVQRQTAGLFVAEDRGAHALKGVPTPVALYRIVRASGGRRLGARALTPLIGREEELGLLRRRWERAARGEGQLALVIGEPGIGKSRLAEEFRLQLGGAPHTFVEWSSSQLLQNTPLHPLADWGRQRFGADEPAARRLADLENTLRLIGLDASEYAPLLAPLVDIPLSDERAAKLAPEELRRRQLAAMTTWVLAGARSQPAVLAFEDLHWADPTSLDLMAALAERGAEAPLFIVATARPEFRPPWSVRSHHSVISLSPLGRADVARMVGDLAARHALSRELVEGVSERSGGVPLFVEEVTRLLLERGAEGGARAIPPTLQQSLAARLDRLGEGREAAQIGAVLGREFRLPLLRDVAEMDEPALRAALERLAEADILFVEGAGSQATFRFKHALIQDAAYDSLLKSRRQALHRRAAERLRGEPGRAAAEPEVIAHHFTQAGLDELAIEWWGKAGDSALRRSAFQEAVAHLGKAIAMADRAGGEKAPAALGGRQQLQVAYGNALFHARGYGAPETAEAFARARESAVDDKGASERLKIEYALWAGNFARGELQSMRAHAGAFLRDVSDRPDSPEAGVAHRCAGTTHLFAGEYQEACAHLEQALALFQPGRDDDLADRFGQDAGVSAMLYLALVLWPMGDAERAVSLARDAKARTATLTHIGARAYGMCLAAVFELVCGNLSRAAPHASELARLAHEHDLLMWRAYGIFLEGAAKAEGRTLGRGLRGMRRGAELLREQKVRTFDGLAKMTLADAEARAGDVDRAVAILDEALATSERTSNRTFEAELHRARGEMLLKRDPANPAAAGEALQTAIAVAKQQGTRSFELGAALALAKLHQSTGRPIEAHAVLAPALEGFSPTPEMPEVAAAQALLAALADKAAGPPERAAISKAEASQRVKLQADYAQALLWLKGYSADEAKAAFERTSALAARAELPAERFSALYGQFLWSWSRGQFRVARDIAERFLREAEAEGRIAEARAGHVALGQACMQQGDLREARIQLDMGLSRSEEPGGEIREKFGFDLGAGAAAILAFTMWLSGDVPRGRELIEEATRIAGELSHPPTTGTVLLYKIAIETARNDFERVVVDAENFLKISQQHSMGYYLALSRLYLSWCHAHLGGAQRLDDFRRSLADYRDQGNRVIVPGFLGALARLEAIAQNDERALAVIDEALAMSQEGGDRLYDSSLHRLQGNILLKRDPANPARAEEAFQTSLAIAKRQGARTFELLASLALARLYQATGRLVEAHAVLAPALEGFSPTPEMPAIAKAQAVLAALRSAGSGSAR